MEGYQSRQQCGGELTIRSTIILIGASLRCQVAASWFCEEVIYEGSGENLHNGRQKASTFVIIAIGHILLEKKWTFDISSISPSYYMKEI